MASPFIRTLDDFLKLVTLETTTESLILDFKRTVDPKEPEWQQELCRDVAQFANTWGGCLLVGVEEGREPSTGLKVASRIRGVTDPDAVRGWVEQAITNHLVPSTLSHDICFVTHSNGTLVAVNAVWVDSGGRLAVLLSVRLLYSDKNLTFEPIEN
jgi:hypothetical protein